MLDRCYPWGMGVVREEQSNEGGKREFHFLLDIA